MEEDPSIHPSVHPFILIHSFSLYIADSGDANPNFPPPPSSDRNNDFDDDDEDDDLSQDEVIDYEQSDLKLLQSAMQEYLNRSSDASDGEK